MPGTNEFGQPIGESLDGWESPVFPPAEPMLGRTVELEPLSWDRHGLALFDAFAAGPASMWTYMPFGPFSEPDQLKETIEAINGYVDWSAYAIVVSGEPLGFASYLRVKPAEGVIEVGSIAFAQALQRTTPATEALYLMIANVFGLGYRRCEWKCDALNEPSRSAGLRLGFVYEGTFRQATHYKGRNRDTAWFAITDDRWARLDLGFRRWLAEQNFDSRGNQIRSLGEFIGGEDAPAGV